MNTILGIEVPSSFDGMPADQVTDLVETVRQAALEVLRGGTMTTTQTADCERAAEFVREGRAYVQTLAEAEDEANDRLDALEEELSDTGDDGDVEDEDEEDEGVGGDADGDEDEGVESDQPTGGEPDARPNQDVDVNVNQPSGNASVTVLRRRRRPTASQLAERVPADRVSLIPEAAPITALPGNGGIAGGDRFESTAALADALQARWRQLGGGSDERLGVARVTARYPEELHLVAGDNATNIEKFGGLNIHTDRAQEAITAAVCAPAQPYYGLGCESSNTRPLWNSLPKYQAPRGNVSVYPSPKLADLGGGPSGTGSSAVGIWTQDDDANPDAVKTCARLPCAEPTTYGIYGAYACLTIKNMMAMTYPELVEAFLNRLGAIHASMRERALLDGMLASVNMRHLTAAGTGESATTNLLATVLNLLAAAREEERYDDSTWVGWAPRWVREVIRIDLLRYRNTAGGSVAARLQGNAAVDAVFAAAGINMTWVWDYPSSGWDPMPIITGGNIPPFPTNASIIVAPRGNFRALDGGNLTIGVTNNNIYRDNESNRHNEFTMFMENYEGIIDFGCTSYELEISDFCPTGAQVDDVAPIAC